MNLQEMAWKQQETGIHTKVNSKVDSNMVEVFTHGLMDRIMKESGLREKYKEGGSTNRVMEGCMMDSGRRI